MSREKCQGINVYEGTIKAALVEIRLLGWVACCFVVSGIPLPCNVLIMLPFSRPGVCFAARSNLS